AGLHAGTLPHAAVRTGDDHRHGLQAARSGRFASADGLPQGAQGGLRQLYQGGPRLMTLGTNSMNNDTILKVDHLSMKFGGLMAINDFSFEARRGEITALI